MIKTIEGDFRPVTGRIAIACARFNGFIVESLKAGALDALRRHGIKDEQIDLAWAPGAYELPLLVKKLAGTGRYRGIVALGAVIRGGTPHFDYVAGECSKGLATVSMDAELPIGFGVLTVDSIDQAIERAGTKAGNKGAEAAMTVIEMINLLSELDE
jgi:6,7-dimethyl-8-ribityllumazine synthase